MRGLKVFLFINFLSMALYGLADLFFPDQVRAASLGQDPISAPHVAMMFLAFSGAVWYAFRNPAKNVAVVRALIAFLVLDSLAGIFQSMTGVVSWNSTAQNIILPVVLAGGLMYFYPRGEKAT